MNPGAGITIRIWVFRFIVASGVWAVVTGISLLVAWQNAIDAPAARIQQYLTQDELRDLAKANLDYQKKFGEPARSISDLEKMTNDLVVFDTQSDGDGWHHPFVFSVSGTNVTITSYGRDGKPGGIGLDCDLTTANWAPPEARPTFEQFVYDMPTGGMIKTSIACGGLAFLLALFTIKIPTLSRSGFLRLALRLILTTIAAAFVATIITGLHVPSGH